MNTAIFYHAGCPVCLNAEQGIINAIDTTQFTVETVHLGEQANRIAEAKAFGVQSVPALVLNHQVFHINFGASINDLT